MWKLAFNVTRNVVNQPKILNRSSFDIINRFTANAANASQFFAEQLK